MTHKNNLPIIAVIQMCSSHIVEENLATAQQFITEAAHRQASIAVLPENFVIMGKSEFDKVKYKENIGTGLIQNFLATMAKENNIWLVAGTIPLTTAQPNKVRAACLVYDNQGQVVSRYDKIHLFDAELNAQETYQESASVEAGQDIAVIETPIGKVGLAVCFDIRFPGQFKMLAKLGAQIFIIPAAFTEKTGKAHWHVLMRARAIDTFSYVVGSAQGGCHSNQRETYGHSIIINPWGEIIAEKADNTPGIIYAPIDLGAVNKARQAIPLSD